MEQEMIKIGYPGLFMYGDESRVYDIWDKGKNRGTIEYMISNESSSLHGKFLAAEVLRHFNIEVDQAYTNELAKAYAYALSQSSDDKGNLMKLNGNLWGFLYDYDDCGHLGKQFLHFGSSSLVSLIPLLEDNAQIFYDGSKEATMGNAYKYRIKDFAAFYISRIKNVAITFYQGFEERDEEIEKLKKILDN